MVLVARRAVMIDDLMRCMVFTEIPWFLSMMHHFGGFISRSKHIFNEYCRSTLFFIFLHGCFQNAAVFLIILTWYIMRYWNPRQDVPTFFEKISLRSRETMPNNINWEIISGRSKRSPITALESTTKGIHWIFSKSHPLLLCVE